MFLSLSQKKKTNKQIHAHNFGHRKIHMSAKKATKKCQALIMRWQPLVNLINIHELSLAYVLRMRMPHLIQKYKVFTREINSRINR